jgi:hypothetical protein
MRIQQISAGDRLTQIALSILLEEAPLIGLWEFYPHPGNSDNPRKDSSASGGQYRSLNDDYPDNEVDAAFESLILAILGDVVQTDQAHERRGFDMASVRASDLRQFARTLARFLIDEHINGAGQGSSPPKLNGLEGMLDMNDDQAYYAEDNSTPLTVQNGNSDAVVAARQKLKRKIKALIQSIDGGADALLMSNDMHAFLTTVFEANFERRETDWGVDIMMFDGVDIYGLGYDYAGTPVLAQDEQPGSITTNTQSIYAAKYGERSDLAMSTNNGVNVIDNGLVGNHYEYNVELDAQQGRLNDRAVGRLAGIELK